MRPATEAILHFNSSPERVFAAGLEAVKNLGFHIKTADQNNGYIEARTSISWFSWGETIRLSVHKAGSGQTSVIISSKMRFQLFDIGQKNQEHVYFIEVSLKQLLK